MSWEELGELRKKSLKMKFFRGRQEKRQNSPLLVKAPQFNFDPDYGCKYTVPKHTCTFGVGFNHTGMEEERFSPPP